MRFLSADGRRIQNSEPERHFEIELDHSSDRQRIAPANSWGATARHGGARPRRRRAGRANDHGYEQDGPPPRVDRFGEARLQKCASTPRYAKSSLTRYTGRYKL